MHKDRITPGIKRKILSWIRGSAAGLLVFAVAILLAGGHWNWLWGWIYIALLTTAMAAHVAVLVPINPALLADRSEGLHQAGTKPWDRPVVAAMSIFMLGSSVNLGAGMARFGMEPMIVTLAPKASSGPTPIVHTGREFVYCLEGYIEYTVDKEVYLLEPNDSLIFEAYLPHRWKNLDATPSRNLLIHCPMDERDNAAKRHFE